MIQMCIVQKVWCCLCLSAMFLNLIWICLLVPNANGKYNMSQLQWEEYIDPPNYLQNDSKGSSLPFWFGTDLNIKTAVKMFQLRQSQFYMCRRTMSLGLLLISLLTWTSVQSSVILNPGQIPNLYHNQAQCRFLSCSQNTFL